jgi:hypothetical protein
MQSSFRITLGPVPRSRQRPENLAWREVSEVCEVGQRTVIQDSILNVFTTNELQIRENRFIAQEERVAKGLNGSTRLVDIIVVAIDKYGYISALPGEAMLR